MYRNLKSGTRDVLFEKQISLSSCILSEDAVEKWSVLNDVVTSAAGITFDFFLFLCACALSDEEGKSYTIWEYKVS